VGSIRESSDQNAEAQGLQREAMEAGCKAILSSLKEATSRMAMDGGFAQVVEQT